MHQAIPFPENDPGLFEGLRGIAPQRLSRIPDNDFIRGDTHLVGGILTEVLIRKKEDLLTLSESPRKGLAGVGGSADDAAGLPAKGFNNGVRIHIGHGHYFVGRYHGYQFIPGALHHHMVGHIGHPATGLFVRDLDGLALGTQNTGALGHKMYPAKHNPAGLAVGRFPG